MYSQQAKTIRPSPPSPNNLEFVGPGAADPSGQPAAPGGGVTGDMAGFAAAVYLRGIQYVQRPTTLLAADSSVGDKTAIDLTAAGGRFLQPAAVLCDTGCLATLSQTILAHGVAEAIKTGRCVTRACFPFLKAAGRRLVGVPTAGAWQQAGAGGAGRSGSWASGSS